MAILVTGGAGFIGSNFVLDWLRGCDETVINLDALTYAGNLHNLTPLHGNDRHVFVRGNIGDRALVGELLARHQPRRQASRLNWRRSSKRPSSRHCAPQRPGGMTF